MKSNNKEKLTWPFLVNINSGLVVEALMTLVNTLTFGNFQQNDTYLGIFSVLTTFFKLQRRYFTNNTDRNQKPAG